MNRPIYFLVFALFFSTIYAQEDRLPTDFRQHNLTTYNSSLLNPAFSVGRNNPESLALWSRWQWQGIDANPTTLFVNYTRRLNERSAAGAGFFQHNSGIFFETGAALNYAYAFRFGRYVKLTVGANFFGFKQKLADDRFQVNSNLQLPVADDTSDFILQMAPGINLNIHRFSFSLTSDNLVDYNFTNKEENTASPDKTFMTSVSYDIPLSLGSISNSFLRPAIYSRTLPGQSNQYGFNTLLSTDGYYGQVGYNNFYGYALGAGYTFFKHVTVGASVEIGTSTSLHNGTSFELMASYFLGTPDKRHTMIGDESDMHESPLEVTENKQNSEVPSDSSAIGSEDDTKTKKRIIQERKEAEKEEKKAQKATARKVFKQERIVQDSLSKASKQIKEKAKKNRKQFKKVSGESENIKEIATNELSKQVKVAKSTKAKEEEEAKAVKTAKDEMAVKRVIDKKVQNKEKADMTEAANIKTEQKKHIKVVDAKAGAIQKTDQVIEKEKLTPVKRLPGERYEEVQRENGLLPGFYLIANVFSTDKYYNIFMANLKSKGLDPKSFKTAKNGYHYVFLKRYSTIQDARTARDSQFNGKYADTTWVFRVLEN